MNTAQANLRHLALDGFLDGFMAYHRAMSEYVDNSAVVMAHQAAHLGEVDPRRIVAGIAVLATQLDALLDLLKVLAVAEAVPYADVFTLEGYGPLDYANLTLGIIAEWASTDVDEAIVQVARGKLDHVRDMERMVLNAQR